MSITLLVFFALLGIGLAVIFNIFIIKNYPAEKRKASYIKTIIIFFLIFAVLAGIITGWRITNRIISDYAADIEHKIKINNSANEFVRYGLDLNNIQNDITKIGTYVEVMRQLLPSNTELGVSKLLYGFITDFTVGKLEKKLNIFNYSADKILIYTNDKNVITVTSLVGGLRSNAQAYVRNIALIASSVFVLLLLIYIIPALFKARKAKKAANAVLETNVTEKTKEEKVLSDKPPEVKQEADLSVN